MHKDLRQITTAYIVTIVIGATALITLPFSPLWNALLADIIATIEKIEGMGRIGRKRKAARC